MEKKPLNDEIGFYNGYEETNPTYLNENEKVEFVPKHDFRALKKKSFILVLLMTVPMAICFAITFWGFDFFIKFPVLSQILSRFYDLLGIVAGFSLSTFVVKNISLDDEKKDIVNKHVIHFMGFAAVSWIAIECIDVYEDRNSQVMENTYRGFGALIPLAIAVGLIIWGYFIYTKLEKKLFIPVMCVTILFTGIMIVRDIARPRFDVESYSVDYYFVSYKEIKPKEQEAKYYVSEELDGEKILYDSYVSPAVLKNYEEFERDIVQYDNSRIQHKVYCDDFAGKVLNDIIKDNPIYDNKLFEENYLVIEMLTYYDVPESVKIGRIFVDSDNMKMREDYLWEYEKDELSEDMSEFCIVFIKIPKTYNMENIKSFGGYSKYTYKN